jgi:hypothetical protein
MERVCNELQVAVVKRRMLLIQISKQNCSHHSPKTKIKKQHQSNCVTYTVGNMGLKLCLVRGVFFTSYLLIHAVQFWQLLHEPPQTTISHDTKSAVHSLNTRQCPENVTRGMNTLSPLSTLKAIITNVARNKGC